VWQVSLRKPFRRFRDISASASCATSEAQTADSWDSQGGAAMKRISIPRRRGHELDADADDCLAYLNWAGILTAHLGRTERGRNILWVEDADVECAGLVLRARGFD
jgi:hypothetical protein